MSDVTADRCDTPQTAAGSQSSAPPAFRAVLDELVAELDAAESADAARREDPVEMLRDAAEWHLRSASGRPLPRPFHHAYLTPATSPAVPAPPGRLDVRF